MYIQGHGQYNYHVQHYGHPSKVGFKEICDAWKAERWDPERLIQLYQRDGAKYFVALANHHCNFDCWDSRHHAWNSVNIGPKKDLVGLWAKAARKHGLRVGVTVHCARAWDWYNVAHGSDKEGPLKGVPYDGALTKADGKGTWWEGHDPADLYGPHGDARTPEARQAYILNFYRRVRDLIDSYRPDLLYFDDGRLPISDEVGLRIAAHYYNASIAWHDGRNEAVMNTKGLPPELRMALVWDIERGRSDRIEPFPWQTDTCIGHWHYHRGIRYKTARQVVHMLADIVSKNGNLLLNIPVRGDGTIDDQEVRFLEEMAAWIAVNGEAIYGTRPWIAYGEGPARVRGGAFHEGQSRPFTARDIRFTTKGNALYAIAFGWPGDGKLSILSLAKLPGVKGQVSRVELLGHRGELQWTHDANGLTVALPPERPCDHAFALRITGERLRAFDPEVAARHYLPLVRPDADGHVTLNAADADVHGAQVRIEQRAHQPNIGYWDRPQDWVSWAIEFPAPAAYEVTAQCATPAGPSEFVVELAKQQLVGRAPRTNTWDDYETVKLGRLEVKAAGKLELKARPRDAEAWKPINLMTVRLEKLE